MVKDLLSTKKYFIFDLDGTLVDLEELNYNTFKTTIKDLFDLEFSHKDYLRDFSGSGSHKGFERFLKRNNLDLSSLESSVIEYRKRKEESLRNDFNGVVKIKSGSIEYLKMLKANNFGVALGTSNILKVTEYILKNACMYEYFDTIVTVDIVEHTKPAPDIFLKAMEILNGNIQESVVFEDSPNGILAAKNSGIDCVCVRTMGWNEQVVNHEKYVIDDYTQII